MSSGVGVDCGSHSAVFMVSLAYFLGQKELFERLTIAEMEIEWVKHPVFHIDLIGKNYTGLAASYYLYLSRPMSMNETIYILHLFQLCIDNHSNSEYNQM
jgi:hypothetical protein